MSKPRRRWHLLPHDPARISRLASELRLSPVIAQLLLNRGHDDRAKAVRFLDAPMTALHPPEQLPGIPKAVERILDAVKTKRQICVYGDYDVDGTTGTSILVRLLRHLGGRVRYHLPLRLEEGYGLNVDALRRLAEEEVAMVITVDCGITSVEEALEAKRLGVELIVTDHHEAKETYPDADVVVHPRLPGGEYPFGYLSGSAVAFKLAWALAQGSCEGDRVTAELRELLLDFVVLGSLGVVADVVPLVDENRILVRYALERLRTKPSVGLRALLERCKLSEASKLRAEDIGFRLGPRLNAAGRLGSARTVVELLTTRDPAIADKAAQNLEQQNANRKAIEQRIIEEIENELEGRSVEDEPALVLAGDDWHPGVIGIVAGRMADRYARPSLVIAIREGAPAVGSARTIPGFALHTALKACESELVSHGGHAGAAGFKVDPLNIDAFRAKFTAYTAEHFPERVPPAPKLTIDAEVPLSSVTMGLLRDLDRLEPYGEGNPKPVFLAGPLDLAGDPRKMGQGEKHMSFKVKQGQTSLRAVAFGMGERYEELISGGGSVCVVFTPKLNEWNGHKSVVLEVIDFQPGPVADLE